MKRSLLMVSGLVLLILTNVLFAQTDRGTIRGTVEDTSGAAVAGAEVVATNIETGVQTTTHSTESGNYNLPNLPPGNYNVTAEKPGFKKLVRTAVRVDVAGMIGLDLQLAVGEVTESVTIEASAPQLRTESSSVSTAVNPKTFIDLPLNA